MDDDLFGEESAAVPSQVDKPAPHVLSTVREAPNAGGSRGLFAVSDIPAGTLVVLEWPTFSWKPETMENDYGWWLVVDQISRDSAAYAATNELHPRVLADVSENELREVESEFLKIPVAQRPSWVVERDEVLRIYLVLKHNGFSSGLYLSLCMINHSCSPNCIKYEPRRGSRGASEVWTVQNVAAGDELLISYLHPPELSWIGARQYLQQQHAFSCTCPRCIQCTTSQPSTQEESIIQDMESSLAEMEQTYNENATSTAVQQARRTADGIQLSIDIDVLNDHLSTVDGILEAAQQLSADEDTKRRLSLRALQLQCALCSLCLSLYDGQSKHLLTARHYAQRLAQAAAKSIVQLVGLSKGTTHPTLTTLWVDLGNAVEFLMKQRTPKSKSSDINSNLDDEQKQESTLAAVLGGFLEPLFGANTAPVSTAGKRGVGTGPLAGWGMLCTREAQRLKSLYLLAQRDPGAVKVIKRPGGVYWGSSSR